MIKLRGSSGPLTASKHGKFLDEVIAELFPRVKQPVLPATDSGGGEDCEEVSVSEIRVLLDAAVKKRTTPGPNGMHYVILDKSAL